MNKYEIHQEYYYYNHKNTVRVFYQKFETFEEAERHLLEMGLIACEDFYHASGRYYLNDDEYARPTYIIVKVGFIDIFDDIVFDDIGCWSQICKDCLDKYPQLQDQKNITIEDHGSGICGVKGCGCEETIYITFERGAE